MGYLLSMFMAGLALAGGVFYMSREGMPHLQHKITVISESETVEAYLQPLQATIHEGTVNRSAVDDYVGYRRHIYRVLTYALHILNDTDNKYRRHIELGLVYHDIALWTDNELAYLEPSAARCMATMREEGSWSQEEMDLVYNIIYWHHKITPFVGPHADVVNAVRLADHIDASKGFMSKGMPWAHINKVIAEIPFSDFHQTLMLSLWRISGSNFAGLPKGLWDLAHIMKW